MTHTAETRTDAPSDLRRYGLWTVLGPAEPAYYEPTLMVPRSRRASRTRVRCECGLTRAVQTTELRGGRSRGCRKCRSHGRKPHVSGRAESEWQRGGRGERSGSDG